MTSLFENKKVIVAGGSSGIGLAVANLLARKKATVTITGRNAEKLNKVEQAAGIATTILDSNDRPALDAFFKKAGRIDHLVMPWVVLKGQATFQACYCSTCAMVLKENSGPS
jgi:NADP-dependent 3-hydroxy acid dehydrogenase YdfG